MARISFDDLFMEPCKNKSRLLDIIRSTHPDNILKTGFWLFAEFLSKDSAYFDFGSNSPWDPTYLIYTDEDDNVVALHAYRTKDPYIPDYAHLMGLQVLEEYSGNNLSKDIMKDTMEYILSRYPNIEGFTLQCHEPSLVNLYRRYGFRQIPGHNLMVYTLPGYKKPIIDNGEINEELNFINKHFLSYFLKDFRRVYNFPNLDLATLRRALDILHIEPDLDKMFSDDKMFSIIGKCPELRRILNDFKRPMPEKDIEIPKRFRSKPISFHKRTPSEIRRYEEIDSEWNERIERNRRYREEMDNASQELLDLDNF